MAPVRRYRLRDRVHPKAEAKAEVKGGAKAGDRAREQLLEAAGEIFAEQGYDRATGKEICERAGMNTAAVNYHFGGIDALYVETLVRAHRRVFTIDALQAIAASDVSPRDKLRAYMAPIVRWLADPVMDSWEMRLLSREIISPSPVEDAFIQTEITPKIVALRDIIAAVIGAHPEDVAVGLAVLVVVAPCILLAITNRRVLKQLIPPTADQAADTEALVHCYVRFIEAGLEAMAREHRVA